MTTIPYDRARSRFPDVNEGHPVEDWDVLVQALGDVSLLGFKVGNGWLPDPMSDSAFAAHLQGAESHGLVALGYWFGAQKVERFLAAFPPKEGRIPCLDFEFPSNHDITRQDVDDAVAFVAKVHDAWGRRPWFYGNQTWVRAGQPTGTEIQECPYWGPDYNGELPVPTGVGTPVAHQYAASSAGPDPVFFPGVANIVQKETVGGVTHTHILGPDMNSLLVPFDMVRQSAGLGGDEVPLNAETDQETFNEMLATALGLGGAGDPPFWERILLGIGDVVRGHEKRHDMDEPYGAAFDWAASLQTKDGAQPGGP